MINLRINLESLVWRLLTSYGRLKYRYFLPVYSLLGLTRKGVARPELSFAGALAPARLMVRGLGRLNLQRTRQHVSGLMERTSHSRGTVLFLPSAGWYVVNTQRNKHLAREFAAQGYVSIYDSQNSYDDVSGLREVEHNVFLFRGDLRLLKDIPRLLLWALPYNYQVSGENMPGVGVVYDWIDDLQVFPFDQRFLLENHARALKEATAVFCSSRKLLDEAQWTRPDALYLPNAVDVSHFADNAVEPLHDRRVRRLLNEGKPIAGYYGALAKWFNYELISKVAGLRPDWSFLLIGPRYDSSLQQRGASMLKRPNVHWIGPRSYEALPAFLRAFDVAMIPFVVNDVTLATSPLKLFEYFAGGKPVISTPLPECRAFDEVRTAGNPQDFSQALDAASSSGRDREFVEHLRLVAQQNSWATRVRKAIEHLEARRRGSTQNERETR